MEPIFISWGSPDAGIVQPVTARLRQSGLQVQEYGSSMLPGSDIQQWVADTIASSKLALIFLSEETADRPWLQTEIAWCFQEAKRKGLHIVPVLIGNVPEAKLHHLLQNGVLRRFTLSPDAGFEGDLLTLVEQIRALLGAGAPTVVTAALMAMTAEQAGKLILDSAQENLSALCEKMGMGKFSDEKMGMSNFAELVLKGRYGARAEDFSPFPGGTLVEQIHRSLDAANVHRRRDNRAPIWLRWCTAELLSENYDLRSAARDLWVKSPSLLVVDSISLLEPSFKRLIQTPPSDSQTGSALLWVPPYTRHTSGLEQLIEHSLQALGKVLDPANATILDPFLDKFRKWGNNMEPLIAFDIGTAATLRRWLYTAFGELDVKLLPDDSRTSAMTTAFGTDMKTGAFFRMGAQP